MHHSQNFGTEQRTSIRAPEKAYHLLKYIAERLSSERFIKSRYYLPVCKGALIGPGVNRKSKSQRVWFE